MVGVVTSRVFGAVATLLVVIGVLGGAWSLLSGLAAGTAVGLLVVMIAVGGTCFVGYRAGGEGQTAYW